MKHQYRRVLVSFPLGEPNNVNTDCRWSTLHWCDIQQDDESCIQIRVAAVGTNGKMPNPNTFQVLERTQCTRIRVIDLSEGKPTYYCLSLMDTHRLYRFDFSSYQVLLRRGKEWTPEISDDEWSDTKTIMNSSMRGDEDYKALTILEQDNSWMASIMMDRKVASPSCDHWRKTSRNETVSFQGYSDNLSRLTHRQRDAIQSQLMSRLETIKRVSNSEDAYCNALLYILNRQAYADFLNCNGHESKSTEDNQAQNHELKLAVDDFNIQFLHPKTLQTLYPDFYTEDNRSHDEQPARKDVHEYILNLVFFELNKHQPQNKSFCREVCPRTYTSQRIDYDPSHENEAMSSILTPNAIEDTRLDSGEYIQHLLSGNKTIKEVLFDELILVDLAIKNEIITILITHPSQLTQTAELIDLLECLSPNEQISLAMQLPADKWRLYAVDTTGFRKLIQDFPLLIEFVPIECVPNTAPVQLGILDATIQRIKPEYSELSAQAKRVLNELKNLGQVDVSTIKLIVNILRASPGEQRNRLLNEYIITANNLAAQHPSQSWKKLGISMAILGGLIAAIGGALLLTGIATATTGALIAGGSTACVVSTVGFFYHRSKTQTLPRFSEQLKTLSAVPLLTS